MIRQTEKDSSDFTITDITNHLVYPLFQTINTAISFFVDRFESFSIGEDGARDAVEIFESLRLQYVGDRRDSSSRGNLEVDVVDVVDKVTIFTLVSVSEAGMLMAF
jgi:hypothetical protein